MAYKNDWATLKNVPVRPMTKGMIKNLPSNSLPSGAFLELENYRVSDVGIEKRGGFRPFNINEFSELLNVYDNDYLDLNSKIQDVLFFWRPDAEPEALIITNTQLFKMLKDNKNIIRELKSTIPAANITSYTVNTVANTVEVVTIETEIGLWRTGDYAYAETGNTQKALITEVRISGGVLLLSLKYDDVTAVSGDLTGYHLFKSTDTFGVDWTVTPGYDNKVILCDTAERGIYEYNGIDLSIMTIDNGDIDNDALLRGAKVCSVFADRLWVANTLEDTGTNRYTQRLRWSQPAAFNVFRDADYLDLPYASGEILKLVPMGSLLVLYTEDAIYFGRQTNMTGLPYAFTRMETGGVGPVSQRAIQPWTDGHFFVGNDDIYWFNASSGLKPITDPILRDTLTVSKNVNMLKKVEIAHDPLHESLIFMFPDISEGQTTIKGIATKLWLLNTKTKGWSYYSVPKTPLGVPLFYFSTVTASRFYSVDKTWQDWIDQEEVDGEEVDWIDQGTAVEDWFSKSTWTALGSSKYLDKTLFIGIYYRRAVAINATSQMTQGIYFETESTLDYLSETRSFNIHTLLESPDMDFGFPDTSKTVTRNSIKCWEQPVERLVFNMEVSDDRGLTWKQLPQIRWNPRYDEGRNNFRSTGSNFRFRISSDQETHTYILTEMVYRVSGRGLQVSV